MNHTDLATNASVANKHRLLIVTTVPETLSTILRSQPRFLSAYFSVSLATSPGHNFEKVVKNEGVETHSVAMRRGISPIFDFLSILKMILLLLKFRPTIIHSYTPKAGLVSMLAGCVCRVPIRIHTFTGLIFPTQTGFKQRVLIWIDRLICACATRIVPEGEGVKGDLYKFKITTKKLQVIGYGNIAGVDTDYFSPDITDVSLRSLNLRNELKIDNNAFVFCFVGRLNCDKGIAELASAFNELPDVAHLLLVGAHDETSPVDAASMYLLRSNSRVHFLGFQDDIRPALACSNVLVLPSYREGFPNSILQAGAMRLPVIATDINGCNEVIMQGFNGWLVPPKNIENLAATMRLSLSLDEVDRKKLGFNARKYIKSHYEQRDHLLRMLHFYNSEINEIPCEGL